MDYNEFKKAMENASFYDLGIEDQLASLNSIVDEKGIKAFYAKNVSMGKSPEEVEGFIFEENKMLKLGFTSPENASVQVLYYRDIKSIELLYNHEKSAKLKINFDGDVDITLNNETDSKVQKRSYNRNILSIYKLLATN